MTKKQTIHELYWIQAQLKKPLTATSTRKKLIQYANYLKKEYLQSQNQSNGGIKSNEKT